MQNDKFRSDPQKNNYKTYSRADFSFDLYRLKKPNENILRDHVQLSVAIRAYTTRRDQFLWIPGDNQGNGSAYSHIKVFEVK